MAGLSYTGLVTSIRNYTEVDSNVLTTDVLENIILNAQYRIMRDIPIDADRKIAQDNLVTNQEHANVPAGALFIRGVEVFNTANTTEEGTWLEKKDQTYLTEYVGKLTGPQGDLTGQDVTGFPKYYAMFGGATGLTDTTSGGMYFAPTPDANYRYRVYFNKMPVGLGTGSGGNSHTYLSNYMPQILLYACLVEAYGFLKGPMDMLTLYENKYKQEVQKFAAEQLGRRKRDDYTDGTVRIKIPSPSP